MSENSFRASVFLCASATGKKLPAFIVFSGATGGPVHCELQAHPLHKADEVVLTVQKNAYCDERIMIEWVNEVCFYFSLNFVVNTNIMSRCGLRRSPFAACSC